MTPSSSANTALMRRTKAELVAEVESLRERVSDLEKGIGDIQSKRAITRDAKQDRQNMVAHRLPTSTSESG